MTHSSFVKSRSFRGTLAALALALGSSASGGCSSTSSASGALFEGPPRLRIDEILPAGGPRFVPGSGACLEIGRDPGGTVAVVLGEANAVGELVNWQLSPPGSCIGVSQCGYVALELQRCAAEPATPCSAPEAVATHLSAGRTITVPLGQVGPGHYQIHVELRGGDGTVARDAEGHAYASDVLVDVRSRCDGDAGTPDAGVDAAADASSTDASPEASVRDGSADAAIDAPAADGSDGTDGSALLDAAAIDASRTDAADSATSATDASSATTTDASLAADATAADH